MKLWHGTKPEDVQDVVVGPSRTVSVVVDERRLWNVVSKKIDRTSDKLVENTSYRDNHIPLLQFACCASLLMANRFSCDLVLL
jgi:hypothetical protein